MAPRRNTVGGRYNSEAREPGYCFRMAALTALGRLNIHLRSFTNLVGSAANNRVAFLQRSEYFDEIADACATTNVDPLGDAVVDADHERALRRRHDARGRYEQ